MKQWKTSIANAVLIMCIMHTSCHDSISIHRWSHKMSVRTSFIPSKTHGLLSFFDQNIISTSSEIKTYETSFLPSYSPFLQTKRFSTTTKHSCISPSTPDFDFHPYPSSSSSTTQYNPHEKECNTTSIYVHIPYCRKRCHYCDFAILPVGTNITMEGHSNTQFYEIDEQYCNAILHEIQCSTSQMQTNSSITKIPKTKLKSIYFGGGTPSLAPLSTLQSILEAIQQSFEIQIQQQKQPLDANANNSKQHDNHLDDTEITIEMDPGTFTKSKLKSLLQMGFNRISLGVQSFHDPTLERIGRTHRQSDILDAVQMIHDIKRDLGVPLSLSIDLISGLPGLTLAQWVETLQFAVNVIHPDHISVYDLQVEKGTVFGKWYGLNPNDNYDEDDDDENNTNHVNKTFSSKVSFEPLPKSSECAFMYRYADGYLKSKGYEHYEISSYAKIGKRSKHNSNYWDIGAEWYAFGLGATSSFHGIRYARPRRFADYIAWVNDQIRKTNPFVDLHRLNDNNSDDEDETLAEIVMTRLRTSDGLDMKWVNETYGQAKVDAILRGMELGFELKLTSWNDDHHISLKSPDGFLFSNTLLSSVFHELSSSSDM